jgi:2-iminobutanoate/2-iminopropanoate deaminase
MAMTARLALCDDRAVSEPSRPIAPSSIAPPAANYAHAVITTGASRWLHTSGVVPVAPDGGVPQVIGEQAEVVWTNIAAMLAEADMGPRHIVSVITYAVVGEPLADVMAARDRFLDGHLTSSTLVTVPALARPEWRIEIAIVAAA